jgi:hypothetical protein
MVYKIRRVDRTQNCLVKKFRALGAKVLILSDVGRGVPDLVLGVGDKLFFVEVKDGAKPPSGRRLTEDEEKFFKEWPLFCHIVSTEEEAENLFKQMSA